MQKNRFTVLVVPVFISLLIISCSSTSGTVNNEAENNTATKVSSPYPAWYNSSKAIHSDDSAYYGYATALATDSVKSTAKAVSQAKAALQSAISSRLETIRNDASEELGNSSNLDSPQFILAIRNAESNLHSAAKIVQQQVQQNGKTNYRSFAKVKIEKSEVITALDQHLSSSNSSWEALKKSEAFQLF